MSDTPTPPGQPDPNSQPPSAPSFETPPAYSAPSAPLGNAAPSGYANSDEKTWALVAHFGGAAGAVIGSGAGGWVAPLIALLAKGNESPTVRAHAVAALNFQILVSIIAIVSWILVCIVIGFVGVIAAVIGGALFGILAGVKANEGAFYKYPMSISLVK
ncbi:putative Tic20 family protein [Allocatelliglobosispora scoriae]|uniref:Putative Tic20 family protein n=1 Tax=Allocatelliglobosispora scoriae TaxID=643052 RepID=A0A841BLH4_9ACTN|nr:DUF4870 domain-containing protein [Allocatelliglobosispora scoriae]MBB5869937.1 putative Tic20 family protein [Allocatelliglobosispora scoriae]